MANGDNDKSKQLQAIIEANKGKEESDPQLGLMSKEQVRRLTSEEGEDDAAEDVFEGREVKYEQQLPTGGTMTAYETDDDIRIRKNTEKIKAALDAKNKQFIDVVADFRIANNILDPSQATGFEDNYMPKMHEYRQSWLQDFGESVYEGLVVDSAKGLTNLVPTVAQAFGNKGEWTNDWITTTTGFFDSISPQYSDAYYRGDSSRKFATALGQGVGFVAGIMLGGGVMGKGLSKAGMGVNTGRRIGSFMMGTNMMYPMIYEEAKEAGINDAHSARLALGISGLVSMTEGAALEWIGKGLSKPVTSKATRDIVRNELKSIGRVENLESLYLAESRIAKGFMSKAKAMAPNMFKGASIEAGQEFSQTYIEEFAKQLYDTVYAPGKKKGEGAFGADIGFGPGSSGSDEARWDTFGDALYGGMIGGIIGGALPATGALKKGGIQQETLFNYVNKSVRKGKPDRLAKIYRHVDAMEQSGDLTTEQAAKAKAHVTDMVKYSGDTQGLNIQDDIASYQMFQLSKAEGDIQKNIDSRFKVSDSVLPAVAAVYKQNAEMGNKISSAINEDMKEIIESKKPATKNKEKFEKRLGRYNALAKKVYDNEITEEQFDKELDKIKGIKPKKAQESADIEAQAVEVAEGITLPKKAIEDAEAITQRINKAYEQGEDEVKKVAVEIAEEYGMDKEGVQYILENPDVAEKVKEPTLEELRDQEAKEIERIAEEKGVELAEAAEIYKKQKDDERADKEAALTEVEKLIEEIETKPDLTERDLDAFMKEADEKGITTPELIDAISGRRTMIKEGKQPTKKADTKTIEDEKRQEAKTEQVGTEKEVSLEKEGSDIIEGEETEKQILTPEKEIEERRQRELSEKSNQIQTKRIEYTNSDGDVYQVREFADGHSEYWRISQGGIPTHMESHETTGFFTKELFEGLSDEKLKEGKIVETPTGLKDKINAKYDAELAELEDAPLYIAEETEPVTEKIGDEDLDTDPFEGMSFEEAADQSQEALEQAQELLSSFLGNPSKKEQRQFKGVQSAETIRQNPELYNKIKNHFQKIFPGIPVTEVEEIVSRDGATVLGRVVETGIEINPNIALQNTIIHEYAHVYLKALGQKNPIVKIGMDMIKDTGYYEAAKELYPNLSEQEQAEEALAEALADSSYDSLRVKFDGTTLDKFLAFAKKFWSAVKRLFTKNKANDIVSIIADNMTFKTLPIPTDVGFLQGMDKAQLQNPKISAAVGYTNMIVTASRVNKVLNPDMLFNPRSVNSMKLQVYASLGKQYINEQINNVSDNDIKLFEGVDLGIEGIDQMNDVELAKAMHAAMKSDMTNMYDHIERTIQSISKRPLPEKFEEDKTDSAVKANQKITESIRAIITSIVDNNGMLISPDNVYRYIALTAKNTLGNKGFMDQLKKDSMEPNKVEAKRLYETIQQMPEGVRQSIITELSSLIQIEYRGLVLSERDGAPSITFKLVNEDYETSSIVQEKLQRLEHFQDDPTYYSSLDESLSSLLSNKKMRGAIKGRENYELMETMRHTLEDIYQESIPEDQFNDFVDKLTKKTDWGFVSFLDRLSAVINQEEITYKAKDGSIKSRASKPSDVNSYTKNLVQTLSGNEFLQNNFVNMQGNNVSSTRFGYWISEQNSLIFNDSQHMKDMKNSPLYKDNPVFKMAQKDGKVDWFVHDAISNAYIGKATEYSRQVLSDAEVSGLAYFANVASKDYYYQNFGVTGDRGHSTYFKVPRYSNMNQIQKQYEKQAALDQKLYDERIKGLDPNGKITPADITKNFNNMSMNKIVDGKVVTPWDSKYPNKEQSQAAQDKLMSLIADYNMEDAIANDNVGPTKIYKTIPEMIEAYYYSDALNRNALMDIYEGPMLHRKSVADVVKRGSGINSGGKKIEIDKPVKIFVLSAKSKIVEGEDTSDSFSFNGSHLHGHIAKQSGDLDKVGNNMKDMVFQVNPKNGRMLFMKMSTMGVTGKVGENNLTNMSDPKVEGNGYSKIGDAILKLEEHIGNDPYIKVVDENVMKGNEGNYQVIDVNDFVNAVENDQFDKVMKSSFDQEIKSYRVAFNLNKNLNKIPLEEQSVVLSTQLAKIALNYGDQNDINEFEGNIVDLLKTNLKLANKSDYASGDIYKALRDQNKLLNGLTKNMDEQEANSIMNIFTSIQEHNENNPEDPISVFDHPNLTHIVQQFIASKFTKSGIRTDIPGAYLHMLPNYGNDLGWYQTNKDEQGNITEVTKIPEIAAPSSMFLQQKPNEKKADFEERKKKALAEGIRTVVVRVPASGGMSSFVANVKYFTDATTNSVVIPDQFIKASDADHDGDKTFVYREERDNAGNVIPDSQKTQIFNKLYERMSSPELVAETEKTLSLDKIKKILDDYGFNQVDDYSLSDFAGVANISNQMSFGGDAIGVLAIASKMLSVLSQSNEKLNKPIKFGYNLTEEVDDRQLTNDKELQNFENISLDDVAKLLQAALDMGNDPVLPSTGINQHTINVATTLTLLGVDIKEITGFLNDPAIKKLVSDLDKSQGNFKTVRGDSARKIVENYMGEIDYDQLDALESDKLLNIAIQSVSKKGYWASRKAKDGIYRTKEGTYFSLNEVDPGQFYIEKIDVVPNAQLMVMNKYVELQEISRDIQKLIPIIQLDNQLPNNGNDLNELAKSFREIEQGLLFSTESFMNRPLIQHYKEMAKHQRYVYVSKFLTEHPKAYGLKNSLQKTVFDPKMKQKLNSSIVHQFSQKYIKGSYPDAGSFVKEFGSQIKNQLTAMKTDKVTIQNKDYQETVEALVEIRDDEGVEAYQKALAPYEEAIPVLESYVEEYDNLTESMTEMQEFADNDFLNYLTFTEADGTVLIKPKRQYRRSTENVKKGVREDFLKLPQSLQSQFMDYQLLRFGIDDKIGSMIDMLPQDIHVKVLQDISKANKRPAEFYKNKRSLLERNAILSLANQMDEATSTEPISKGKVAVPYEVPFIKYGGEIYKVTKETKVLGEWTYHVYDKMTGDNFQYGDHFVKFGKDVSKPNEATNDQANDLKKDCN